MSVGVLAHLFGKQPYEKLATQVGAYGFTNIQLALWKAIDNYPFSEQRVLSPALAKKIADEFAKHGVSISVLACYLHLFERDAEAREVTLERYKECIRHARFFGAPMVATEVGKPTSPSHKEDWKILVRSVADLAKEAEKWGVFLGLEAANGHLAGTASQLKALIDDVKSSHIGVVIDPGNLMTKENFSSQDDVIAEAFDLLGDRIIAAHAKDRKFSETGELLVFPAGQGEMNYDRYLNLLEKTKPDVPIILEECRPEEMGKSKRYIESIRQRYAPFS
ncbi:sugar phosphate isomerase/epimerase family protein [Salipaludibacillus agaradhaerens]|uniref:sugar phosphate isomerase/epimerase family protein n=1 Tax=Salipaludibacillus agaradhaerens TaxID=76935 RepID=UPI0009986C20|nr:sugar phosphate isomerase/epimerase [Salipaludibacillus agaradhaerens]